MPITRSRLVLVLLQFISDCGIMDFGEFVFLVWESEKMAKEFQLSPRIILRPGDTVRLSNGPIFKSETGVETPMRLPGLFEIIDIVTKRARTWFDVVELELCDGVRVRGVSRTVLVKGPTHKRHGVRWKPFDVRRVKR